MKQNSITNVENLTVSPTCGKPNVVGSTVILGDCAEVMKGFEDNQFDLAIVDPPYGISIAANGNLHNNSKYDRGFKKNKDYKPVDWDDAIPDENYFKELQRVSKKQIIFGGNFFFEYLQSTRSFIVWYKKGKDKNPNFSPAEFAWTNCDGLPKVYFIDWIGFGYINSGEEKIHPTHKPIKLYESIMNDFCKEGFKILDTHLGGGSSRIAADKLGLDFTGIEIDIDHFNNHEKRFKQYKSQLRIEGW